METIIRGRGRGRASEVLFANLLKKKAERASRVNEDSVRGNKTQSRQFEDTVYLYKKKVTLENGSDCICDRRIVEVRCGSCNNTMKGRPTINCPVHKNIIHLMDITHCPHCLKLV